MTPILYDPFPGPGLAAAPGAPMPQLVLFNKPYGVLCQFSTSGARATLKDYLRIPGIYPAGRLDADSEGLVVLTDDGSWQARISHPRYKLAKTYLAQVEGIPDEGALDTLRRGVDLGGFTTRPAEVERVAAPAFLWPRIPPIRARRQIPACWLRIVIAEGRNRQVRRMTAAVGHPTLRLVRYAVGTFSLGDLPPGHYRRVDAGEAARALSTTLPVARYGR